MRQVCGDIPPSDDFSDVVQLDYDSELSQLVASSRTISVMINFEKSSAKQVMKCRFCCVTRRLESKREKALMVLLTCTSPQHEKSL